MLWAIIAWLYFAGLCASGFILLDVGNLRPARAALFLVAWPITVPFFVLWGMVS